MKPRGPENRYARALFYLAGEQNIQPAIFDAAKDFLDARHDALFAFLADRTVNKVAKKKILTAVAAAMKLPHTLTNFLKLMADKERAHIIQRTLGRYLKMVDASNGVVEAHTKTATPLTDSQKENLTAFVKKQIPEAKHVTFNETVDPHLLGGVYVNANNIACDATIRHRLDTLHQILKTAT